jgi:hypothetical protein
MSNYSGLPLNFNYDIYKYLNKDLVNLNNEELRNHFIGFGIKEGRQFCLPNNFNVNAYRMLNDDLKLFNEYDLIQHYINHGIHENRKCTYNLQEQLQVPLQINNQEIHNVQQNNQNKIDTIINSNFPHNEIPRNEFIFVIARYNEDISNFIEFKNNVMIYNKGNDNISDIIDRNYIKKCPNLGREAGTYCNYILDNYDNLPRYMLFTQANPSDHVAFGDNIETFNKYRIIFNENKNYKFKYVSSHTEPILLDHIAHFGTGISVTPIELGNPKNINELINDIRNWVINNCSDQEERSNELINQLQNIINSGINIIWHWEFNKLFLKTAWYCTSGEAQKMRHDITKNNFDYNKITKLIERPQGFSFGYGALFIVHRDNILKYSKDYWQRLFDSLQELLPGSGWGCERLWGFLLGEGNLY